jgi:hypothetical protein
VKDDPSQYQELKAEKEEIERKMEEARPEEIEDIKARAAAAEAQPWEIFTAEQLGTAPPKPPRRKPGRKPKSSWPAVPGLTTEPPPSDA